MNVSTPDYTRTLAALLAIPALVETLEAELIEGRRGASSRSKPSSRPPAPIGLLSDLDEAWNILTTWAKDWAETYNYTPPKPHWHDVATYLERHWPNAAETHPAAQDFADEINGRNTIRTPVWIILSRHVTDKEPTWQPLPGRWSCPIIYPDRTCNGRLLQRTGEWLIKCDTCSETWTGDDEIVRLGHLLGCDIDVTIAQASILAGVHKATLYRWIEAGTLPSHLSEDGLTLIDKRDLALITARRVS